MSSDLLDEAGRADPAILDSFRERVRSVTICVVGDGEAGGGPGWVGRGGVGKSWRSVSANGDYTSEQFGSSLRGLRSLSRHQRHAHSPVGSFKAV